MTFIEIKTEKLKEVRDAVWGLTKSPLYEYRKINKYYPVLGEGNHDALIMFVGEAPGKNEAITGRPFCGRSGKILDELLKTINISRESVYITNIVKDRPEDNRDPNPEEIAIYAPFLDKQIEIIKPKIIATLGRFSMEYMMKNTGLSNKVSTIGVLHGIPQQAQLSYGTVYIVPLYHPACAIYNRNSLETLKKDFKILKTLIKKDV